MLNQSVRMPLLPLSHSPWQCWHGQRQARYLLSPSSAWYVSVGLDKRWPGRPAASHIPARLSVPLLTSRCAESSSHDCSPADLAIKSEQCYTPLCVPVTRPPAPCSLIRCTVYYLASCSHIRQLRRCGRPASRLRGTIAPLQRMSLAVRSFSNLHSSSCVYAAADNYCVAQPCSSLSHHNRMTLP